MENADLKSAALAAAKELESLVQSWTQIFEAADIAAAELKPAPDKWSVKEILGHLTDSAGNNLQRFVRGQELQKGEILRLPNYGADHWVESQSYQTMSWNRVYALWEASNLHVAHVMRNIPGESLGITAQIGDYEAANMLWLVTDYVEHQKHHLKRVSLQLGQQA